MEQTINQQKIDSYSPNQAAKIQNWVAGKFALWYSLPREASILDAEVGIYNTPELNKLIAYVKFLIAQRKEHFTWNTSIRYWPYSTSDNEATPDDKFKQELEGILNTVSNVDVLMANLNDVEFLHGCNVLLKRLQDEINPLTNKVWWKPEAERDTNDLALLQLHKIIYSIFNGELLNPSIRDLLNSTSIKVFSTPYHDNFKVACHAIYKAIKQVEPDINAKGIFLDVNLEYILIHGPEHEKAHQEAYIQFDPNTSKGKRNRLIQGISGLGSWENFPVQLEINISKGKLVAGMMVDLPPILGLEENLYVLLAPEEPSIGDALIACKEIFSNLLTTDPLYKNIMEFITDLYIELNLDLVDLENNNGEPLTIEAALKKAMCRTYYGKDEGKEFILERFIPALEERTAPIKEIAKQLTQIIKSDKITRVDGYNKEFKLRWYSESEV